MTPLNKPTMKKLFAAAVLSAAYTATIAQVVNTATLDTTDVSKQGKVTVSGYIDLYYGYDFSRPADGNRPYFVSSARHNELSINLAFVDIKYTSANVRARFVPGFGTYMNANYAAEPGTLRNIVEANVGVRLSRSKQIWLDAGVLGSPYTNESAISKDHLMYTRSFAPEYVPYYLSGVKLTLPLSQKVTAYLYGLNGWQQIQDVNAGKALGTQIEYRPNAQVLINWNTYVGDERSVARPTFRTRYFSDIFVIYNPGGRFDATACVYGGIQNRLGAAGRTEQDTWWQINAIGRYKLGQKTSLSGRLEYFNDPRNVQIAAINERVGANANPFQFRSSSASLCLNVKVTDTVLARFESRTFFSDLDVYRTAEGNPARSSQLAIASLAAWF
jgi:hypothetical protein